MSKFGGWQKPVKNFVQVPHAFWEIEDLTAHEKIVLLYILRHTWGFQEFDIMKRITIDEFQHGRKESDGERSDKGCGMSRGGVHKALQELEKLGYIITETDATDPARIKKFYMLNMQADSVHDTNAGFTKRTQGSQSRMRTEKETKERNSKKETKEKDSSSLPEEAAPFIADADSDSHEDIPSPKLPSPVEEIPVIEAVEESASQAQALEIAEVSPVEAVAQDVSVLEAGQPDPDPIAPEELEAADGSDAVRQAEEHVETVAKKLDPLQEVVRRGFAPIGQPLNYGWKVTNLVKFLTGQFQKGDKRVGGKQLDYQLSDRPMTAAQIAGCTLWYRPKYNQPHLPTTLETLRDRCDEFFALHDFDTWVAKGQKVVDQIMAGTDSKIELKPESRVANAQKPPDESDMEQVDWEAEDKKYQESLRERAKTNIPA